jgi:hypothetical protein
MQHRIRPPNVENVGLFSVVPPGQRKPLRLRGRKIILSSNRLRVTFEARLDKVALPCLHRVYSVA